MRLSGLRMGITQGPKYMYERLIPKWRLIKISEPEKYGKGPIGLLKNAYGEQPMVTLGLFLAICGTIRIFYAMNENAKTGYYENKTYKRFYTVMRNDDPRLEFLRKEWEVNGAGPVVTKSRSTELGL